MVGSSSITRTFISCNCHAFEESASRVDVSHPGAGTDRGARSRVVSYSIADWVAVELYAIPPSRVTCTFPRWQGQRRRAANCPHDGASRLVRISPLCSTPRLVRSRARPKRPAKGRGLLQLERSTVRSARFAAAAHLLPNGYVRSLRRALGAPTSVDFYNNLFCPRKR